MNLSRRYKILDTVLLLLLTAVLIAPVFRVKYLDNWQSIESTFISDARILAGNLPHPGWQPLWYCGTRFDYIYPPALRYGTALISLAGHCSTAKAYHIYIGLLYLVGLVSVYWLVLTGSGSRRGAWLSAAAAGLVSPSLVLVRALHNDSPWMIPQRLHVLMSYGEGPHISALSILPAALAASFVALRDWRPRALALAAVLCAFTVSNNFYGATALAIFFPILLWSIWVGTLDRLVWVRGLAIAALAYGLCAFWLTPSYIRITMNNLKWVASPGDPKSQLIMLAVITVFCLASYPLAKGRRDRIWPAFVAGAALILSVDVLGYFYFGLRVLGEAYRLATEMDLALLLLAAFVINALWEYQSGNVRVSRVAAVVVAALLFAPATRYLQHAYSPFQRAPNWQDQYERRIASWVHENFPGERVFPTGTNRYWFDAWFDNPEPDGGSDQGMLNQVVPGARYQITRHDRGDVSVLWLQALGTSAIIVPDNTALEPYHDFATPQKFQGLLPVIFDDHHGTRIYRVPRIFKGIVRVVDRAKHDAVGETRNGADFEKLQAYVSLIESPAQKEPAIAWRGSDALQVQASTVTGESVLLQETYDPAWHAYESGRELPVRLDRTMGFMVIDVAPGIHTLDLRFETPAENRFGQGLFGLSGLIAAALLWPTRTPRKRNAATS